MTPTAIAPIQPFTAHPETKIQRFATRHRLKTRIDPGDDTKVIPGRDGHIFEYSAGRLGVLFIPANAKTAEKWSNRRRSGIAAGMTVTQDGDREGVLTFSPGSAEQARVAITIAAVKRRRLASPAQKEALASGRTLLAGKNHVGLSSGIVSPPG